MPEESTSTSSSMNLFPEYVEKGGKELHRTQCHITVCYAIMLIVGVFVLTYIQVQQGSRAVTHTLTQPTAAQIQALLVEHPDAYCLCNNPAIPVQAFTGLQIPMDPVCSNIPPVGDDVIRTSMYSVLTGICSLARISFTNGVTALNSSIMVSPKVLPARLSTLRSQVQTLITSSYYSVLPVIQVPYNFANIIWNIERPDGAAWSAIRAAIKTYAGCDCQSTSSTADQWSTCYLDAIAGNGISRPTRLYCSFVDTMLPLKWKDLVDTTSGYLTSLPTARQSLTINDYLGNSMLQNGLPGFIAGANFDYNAYLAQCSVSTCMYVQNEVQGPIEIAIVVLSTIGGLSVAIRYVAQGTLLMCKKARGLEEEDSTVTQSDVAGHPTSSYTTNDSGRASSNSAAVYPMAHLNQNQNQIQTQTQTQLQPTANNRVYVHAYA